MGLMGKLGDTKYASVLITENIPPTLSIILHSA